MIAIHNGGILGGAPGRSTMRGGNPPERDYAYAFFVESTASFGVSCCLMLYRGVFRESRYSAALRTPFRVTGAGGWHC